LDSDKLLISGYSCAALTLSTRDRKTAKQIKKERRSTQAAKELLTSIKGKGPLGKKSPFTRKEKGGQ